MYTRVNVCACLCASVLLCVVAPKYQLNRQVFGRRYSYGNDALYSQNIHLNAPTCPHWWPSGSELELWIIDHGFDSQAGQMRCDLEPKQFLSRCATPSAAISE